MIKFTVVEENEFVNIVEIHTGLIAKQMSKHIAQLFGYFDGMFLKEV